MIAGFQYKKLMKQVDMSTEQRPETNPLAEEGMAGCRPCGGKRVRGDKSGEDKLLGALGAK